MTTVLDVMYWVSLVLMGWTAVSVASTLPLVALLRGQARSNQRHAARTSGRGSSELAGVLLSR